jgi:hypothetical protein
MTRKMKPQAFYTFASLCLASFSTIIGVRAAPTIWNGPVTNYSQPAPFDQDVLTANVSITRAVPGGAGSQTGGIYNGITESSFDKTVSPADTEWAVGSLANYATLTYTNWTACGGGHPVQTLPGQQLVVHLISDNIYLSLTFTFLPSGPGLAYTRSTPTVANQPPTVAITSPTNGASFIAPVIVPLTATSQDPDGSVTNVAFFDGTTLLGQTNNAPYTVMANLTAGVRALTSVATDNGGLSTTSSVVNVTVNQKLVFARSGDTLDLSWPAAGSRLLTKTNNLTGSWLDVPNSTATNRVIVQIGPTNGSVFYRLAVP